MRKIHKYPLMPPFIVNAPRDTQWLKADAQNVDGRMIPMVWGIVDDAGFNIQHSFSCLGTGHEVPEHVERHLSTILLEGGQLVLHVFVDKPNMGTN